MASNDAQDPKVVPEHMRAEIIEAVEQLDSYCTRLEQARTVIEEAHAVIKQVRQERRQHDPRVSALLHRLRNHLP